MKRIITLCIATLLSLASISSFAGEREERAYLIQILNQLEAIQPLIIAAKKEQLNNKRVQFHYVKYRDTQDQIHNGLLEDIQAIKKGVEEKLNQIDIEPRAVAPIKGDYIDNDTGGNRS